MYVSCIFDVLAFPVLLLLSWCHFELLWLEILKHKRSEKLQVNPICKKPFPLVYHYLEHLFKVFLELEIVSLSQFINFLTHSYICYIFLHINCLEHVDFREGGKLEYPWSTRDINYRTLSHEISHKTFFSDERCDTLTTLSPLMLSCATHVPLFIANMFYELEQLANVKNFFGFRAGRGQDHMLIEVTRLNFTLLQQCKVNQKC